MINVSTHLISTDLLKLKKNPSTVKLHKYEKQREKNTHRRTHIRTHERNEQQCERCIAEVSTKMMWHTSKENTVNP